jgi:hypothetical protein
MVQIELKEKNMKFDEDKLKSLKGKARSIRYGIELMKKYPEKFEWDTIHRFNTMTLEFLREFHKKIRISELYEEGIPLTEDILREFSYRNNVVDWGYISKYQVLSENFIRDFKDQLTWVVLSGSQRMTADFIEEFKDKIVFSRLYMDRYNIDLSLLEESFIDRYADKIKRWDDLTEILIRNKKFENLSKNFLIKYKDFIKWEYVLKVIKITEDVIEEIKDSKKFDWDSLSKNQFFSEEFFIQNINRLNLSFVAENKNIDYLELEFKNKRIELLLKLNDIQAIPRFKRGNNNDYS